MRGVSGARKPVRALHGAACEFGVRHTATVRPPPARPLLCGAPLLFWWVMLLHDAARQVATAAPLAAAVPTSSVRSWHAGTRDSARTMTRRHHRAKYA